MTRIEQTGKKRTIHDSSPLSPATDPRSPGPLSPATDPRSPGPLSPATARSDSLALAKHCAQVLDSKKLTDIGIFDVRESLQITDFFVIATGLNPRQIKGACDFLDKKMSDLGVKRYGLEGYRDGAWVLLDFDEVVVHLFLENQRRLYDLELLWGDSPRVEWTPLPPTG